MARKKYNQCLGNSRLFVKKGKFKELKYKHNMISDRWSNNINKNFIH